MRNHSVITIEAAMTLRDQIRRQQEKLVFTNGCYEILHIGHVKYLEEAKSLGDVLIVGVNSDRTVRLLKGSGRPITSEDERSKIVSSLWCVDYVIVFDELTPEAMVSNLKPEVYVKGGDYSVESLPEYNIVKSYGGEVHITKYYQGKSTTSLMKRILNSGTHDK
jgi:rfaE bifunctional protein nucleotidyltransferase chain/domain